MKIKDFGACSSSLYSALKVWWSSFQNVVKLLKVVVIKSYDDIDRPFSWNSSQTFQANQFHEKRKSDFINTIVTDFFSLSRLSISRRSILHEGTQNVAHFSQNDFDSSTTTSQHFDLPKFVFLLET